MSNLKMVQDFIDESKIFYCDDCLSEELNIKPRQQINQICRKLMKQGYLKREKKQCRSCTKDKLINMKN